MRWLFLFVLLLNLFYIGWGMNYSSSDTYADVAALQKGQSIVLLSELKQSPAVLPESESGEPVALKNTELKPAAAVSEPGVEVLAQSVNIKSVATPSAVIAPTAGEPGAAESTATEAISMGSKSIAENQAAEETPDVSVSPDSSNASVDVVASVKPLVAAKDELLVAAPVGVCFTLGPFRDLANLRGLTRDIKSYVVTADFRGREEKEQTLYWVYIQPEKNYAKAIVTGKRLKAKKIKDFYVIREGEKINGLSLGHFRNKAGAYGLLKKVKNLGFDVVVEPIFRRYTLYWLDYQLASGVNIPESIFAKHIKSGKKAKINRLSRQCGA